MRVAFIILIALSLAVPIARAEPARDGVLDLTFGSAGIVLLPAPSTIDVAFVRPRDVEVLADGKILLAGTATLAQGFPGEWPGVVRLMPDGDIDTSFGTNGLFAMFSDVLPNSRGGSAHAMARLPDGGTVVVGSVGDPATVFEYKRCLLIFALSAIGQLDTTYGPGPGPSCTDFGYPVGSTSAIDEFGHVASLGDGRVRVVGFGQLPGSGRTVLAQLDAMGQLDTSFSQDGLFPVASNGLFWLGTATGLNIGTDGRSYVSASLALSGAAGYGLFGISADGAIDTTFGQSGFAGYVSSTFVALASTARDELGRFIVGSKVFLPVPGNAVLCHFCISRYTATGALDVTFNAEGGVPGAPGRVEYQWGGAFATGSILSALPRRGTNIVAIGTVDSHHLPGGDNDFGVMGFDADGALDARFGAPDTPGIQQLDFGALTGNIENATAAVVDQFDRIVIAGMCGARTCLIRLTDDQLFLNDYE
jgi:uncharacterized delta-60 repeat protein